MIQNKNRITKLDSICKSDSDRLLRWRNSPEVFSWCRQNDLLSEGDHQGWIESLKNDKTKKMYLILDRADEAIGVCGFTSIDLVNQRAEFSLYIGPENQRGGFGQDALKLLIWHGFNSYPFNIIWGESFSGNPAIKVFERIGFKQEGVRRDFYFRNGRFIDAHLFSIKRGELLE